MMNLRKILSYTLYLVLVVVLFTFCTNKDAAIVETVTVNKEFDGGKYYIKTTEWNFVTDSIYNIGDTLIISRR